ncbi:MAG TPA: hypothetical protein PK195_07375 [Ignavibacteriaceae bacterium]|nr:hypothetical protein [Ignavibacteriaceae bacterium]
MEKNTEIRKEFSAAFLDEEIKDENIFEKTKQKIVTDNKFAVDYKIQLLVRNLIKEKIIHQKTPAKVEKKILKLISGDSKTNGPTIPFFSNIFEKPAFSFATALVIVFAIALIIMNTANITETKNFSYEQTGENNMFVQAQNYFNLITQKKLDIQINTSESAEVLKFFQDKEIKYSIIIPEIPNQNISGAFISDENGEKFAHIVYSGKNNEMTYLYQIDESYLYSNQFITLTNDCINYLDDGNCSITVNNNQVTLFKKIGSNICAVISNGNPDTLEKTFCSQ